MSKQHFDPKDYSILYIQYPQVRFAHKAFSIISHRERIISRYVPMRIPASALIQLLATACPFQQDSVWWLDGQRLLHIPC